MRGQHTSICRVQIDWKANIQDAQWQATAALACTYASVYIGVYLMQDHMQLRETFLKSESMKSRDETYAAVRKALAQLDDPFTRFLGPQQYQVG